MWENVMIPRISAPNMSSASEDEESEERSGSNSNRNSGSGTYAKYNQQGSISSTSRRHNLLQQNKESESPSRQMRSMSVAVPSGAGGVSLLPIPTGHHLAGSSSGNTSAGTSGYAQAPLNPRSRTNSLPNPAFLLDFSGCRDARTCVSVRTFTTTAKGLVNAGDIVRKTSVNNLMSSGSAVPLESHERRKSCVLNENPAAGDDQSTDRAGSEASTDSNSSIPDSLTAATTPQSAFTGKTTHGVPSNPSYFRIVLQGDEGVGKTSLCRQFSSSEYMGTYNNNVGGDGELGETTVVPILLDDEESIMEFIDGTDAYQLDDVNVDAYIVVYSIIDLASFRVARDLARQLRVNLGTDRVIVLVGNKSDLVRKRQIKIDEAKHVATTYDCKYIETSAALNHQVDHLVVGTLTQIRHQLLPPGKEVLLPPAPSRPRSRTPSPVSFFNKLFRRNVKSSASCEGIFMK
ncbi:hypothetical protein RRG08_022561 [Elysia crispata]|uniref:GTP-binding protein RAD n=1 Tax=Elysia crispata TaxID=231223 RepID=A0AAE0Z3F9_9GAST|nr:hypothetical protein RRG08_022561 [Elysia crispata]